MVFNKDFGQHILKNPLIIQGIVDKVRSATPAPSHAACRRGRAL